MARAQRNIKKRFILANYETILDMDDEEKQIMQQTYLNTLQNSRYPPDPKRNKKEKRNQKIKELREKTVRFFFPKKYASFIGN